MDRIFCIDKPQGYTSFDVVAKLRGIIGQRKIGHGGTLDPMATGVLPIYAGKASKVCSILPCDDKRYTAVIRFGVKTDTLDITGSILDTADVMVSEEDVRSALSRFVGVIEQTPPMYSAVKIGGQKLYDLARKGQVIERPARAVTIYKADMTAFDENKRECAVDILCSKGTYIRSLCDDLGKSLGTYGVLTSLRRTQSGIFHIEDAVSIEDMQSFARDGTLGQKGFPIDYVFRSYPPVSVNEEAQRRLLNGAPAQIGEIAGTVRVYGPGEEFLGIGIFEDGQLKMEKLFAQRG